VEKCPESGKWWVRAATTSVSAEQRWKLEVDWVLVAGQSDGIKASLTTYFALLVTWRY